MSRPALFLDRDGVINVDAGYVFRQEEFEWIPGVFDTALTARALGLDVVVATNQAGIARGYYTEGQFEAITAWMREEFARRNAPLRAVYYCPYHPDGIGRYRRSSPDRKPAPGMLLAAARELNLDLQASVLIGDKETDVAAARAAHLRASALLHLSPGPVQESAADAVLRSHVEAQEWLRKIYGGERRPDIA
jgi:D-glycero-D-manno-heptose 1,7-bisphosphate phosphatase